MYICIVSLVFIKELLAEVEELRSSIQARQEKMMNQSSDRGQVSDLVHYLLSLYSEFIDGSEGFRRWLISLFSKGNLL